MKCNQAKLGDLGHSKYMNTMSDLSCIAGTFSYMGVFLLLFLYVLIIKYIELIK